jgi:putative transposase
MNEVPGLPEAVRKLALNRFHLLQPHFEQNRSLRAVADEAGIPYRTAQRWVARYQQFGLGALVRKRRADSGARRAVSAKLREVIEGLALQKPPLPVAALSRQVRRFAKELGEPAPSYWVIYDIVRQLPADLVTLAHQGTKAYSEAFDLAHRREASGPNAIWQADHSPLDILLSALTVNRRNPGSRLYWMITAARSWVFPFLRAAFNPAHLASVASGHLAQR